MEQPAVLQRQVVNSLEQSSYHCTLPSATAEGAKRFLGTTVAVTSTGADVAIRERSLSLATSSSLLSLQERHVPTAEEIAAKKLTFNLWLWGGGFLAPLLATVFYFGPKFWTK
jgi:hypothetical protein